MLTQDSATGSSALRLLGAVVRRAVLNEAIGALQCWGRCGTGQARRELRDRGEVGGQEAAAARVAVTVNTSAQNRADPDWD
ncbi:MAG TPA: hypothetical protein VHU91_05780 [Mycobacteriales bacterium]|jgi:hypothetical protein|nr:hypothetical protein [Mycobacteriales bacterium]